METPKLMVDSSEKNGKAEIVIDYVLSWALRWCDRQLSSVCPILYDKCKYMMCKFLQIPDEQMDSVMFSDIKVWKEEDRIDLWVELVVTQNGENNRHAILIENKYYGSLRNIKDVDGIYRNQLEVYKKNFDKHYASQSDSWTLHYSVYTCIESWNPKLSIYDMAKNLGFQVLAFDDIVKDDHQETESDIYNEVWLRWGA